MRRVYRLIVRKKNIRRLLATSFMLLMFADLGSHAIIDSGDPNGLNASAWCNILHHLSPSADCPHKRHSGLPQANLSNDVVHHWILLGDFTVPVTGVVYETAPPVSPIAGPIDRALPPPFHPPKQA